MADDDLSFESLTFGGENDENRSDDHIEDDEHKHDKSNEEPEKNVIFVTAASYSDKLNSNAVLKLAEELGALKTHNFRDKQSFGFLQFQDAEAVEKALEKLNNSDVEGTKILAEKTARITPGRDPRTHEADSDFKNSTLVLKNLPFQLKQEKLEEILNTYQTKPLNVSYLYDGTGMFRGMAFVKYKEIDHAKDVFEMLNNLDISGRKVRVEYKRVTKENEGGSSLSSNNPTNSSDPDDRKIQDQMNSFKSNVSINELAFAAGTSYQRKQIKGIAEKLGLGTYTSGDFIVIKKNYEGGSSYNGGHHVGSFNAAKSPEYKSESYKDKNQGGGQPIKGRRMSDAKSGGGRSHGGSSHGGGSYHGNSYSENNDYLTPDHNSRDRSNSRGIAITPRSFGGITGNSPYSHSPLSAQHLKSPPNNMGSSPTYRNSALIMNRANEHGPGIQPIRQPKGPDGSNGFSDEYKQQRVVKK